MSINARIKQVRLLKKLSQVVFAEVIGIKQSSLSDIENEKTITIDERTIKLICREYNVNEHWLRKGEGQVFNDDPESLTELLFVKENKLTPLEKKAVAEFLKLSPEQRKIVMESMKKMFS